MIKYVLACILNLFSLWIIKIYLEVFLPKRKCDRATRGVWLFCAIWEIGYMFVEGQLPLINFLSSVILVILISSIAYSGTFLQKFFLTILINVLWMLSELITLGIMQNMGLHIEDLEIAGGLISKFITYVFVKLISVWGDKNSLRRFSASYGYGLFFIPLGSVALIVCIFKLSNIGNNGINFFVEISYVIVLVINMYVFKLYERSGYEIEMKSNNMLMNKQIELCEQYLRDNIAAEKKFALARHDYKNQLLCVRRLLHDGNREACEKLIQQILDNSNWYSEERIANSGNMVIDAIINDKYGLAMKSNIQFNVEIRIPSQLEINDNDICILLSNALDNAIEANRSITDSEKYIHLYMKYEKGVLNITVVNKFSGICKTDTSGNFLSTKKDTINHGIGLQSMDRVVGKYNGTKNIEVIENNEFVLKIMIYI